MTFEKRHYVLFGIALALTAFAANMYGGTSTRMSSVSQEASFGGGMTIGIAPEISDSMVRGPMPPMGTPSAGQTAATVDQKIIKTASLELLVESVGSVVEKASRVASESKGFVQQSDIQERSDGSKYGYITLRVPSTAFEITIERIKAEATLVKRESVNSQDVTEQYTDLEAQLRNAQAQERTYLAVLDKARTVEEILNVQSYLGQIRGQIESLQGRIQYLKNVTEYSTITVTLTEETSVRVPTKEFRPIEAAQQAIQSLIVIGQELIVSLIWLVIVGGGIGIPLALLAGILYLIFRRRKSR